MFGMTLIALRSQRGLSQAEFAFHFGVSAEAFSLRLQELGLITKALRQRLRDDLRAYYKSHPAAMEPEPRLAALKIGVRASVLVKGGDA